MYKVKSLHKYSVARCPGHSNNLGHVVCSNGGCFKQVTQKWYLNLLVPTHKLKVQPGKTYCTKTCYVAANKKATGVPPAWNKDSKNGPEDTNHSMSILIAWLVTPGNLAKWGGSRDNSSKTKTQIASQIAALINAQGVR